MKHITHILFCVICGGLLFSLPARAGTIVAWGANNDGQISGVPPWTNVVAIASGMSHCLALNADGTAVGWGWNYYGQASVPDSWWTGVAHLSLSTA